MGACKIFVGGGQAKNGPLHRVKGPHKEEKVVKRPP